MNQFSKWTVLSTVVVGVLCMPLHAQTSGGAKFSDADLFPDKVLAKGKGFDVKQSEFEEAFIAYKGSLAARGVSLPEEKREKVERDLLDQLILEKILNGKATPEDKAKGVEEAAKTIAKIKEGISEESFNKRLRTADITPEAFRERLEGEGIRKSVLDREVKSKIKISDEEIKKFYDENTQRFEIPEQAKVSHILISTRDRATQRPVTDSEKAEKKEQINKLKQRAAAGEDFAGLAKEFSDHPSKERGGEDIFVRGDVIPALERAAFSLKPGEVSDVVETQFGYHIIKLHEKIPVRQQTLAEVSDRIRDVLTSREFEKQLPDYFARLKKEAAVEVIARQTR